ncbi:MAG: alanine racemase [Victivallaceae bacterium]|nr:alanine racemase [Victivallaceae bacterium]
MNQINTASRVTLDINLSKLCNNLRAIKQAVQPCTVMAVLKADAYGLGAAEIAAALHCEGISAFGVAELHEALELLKYGMPVQIIGNILPNEIETAVANGVIIPINDLETAKKVNNEATRQKRIAECHFLIDCGMGRLGIQLHEALDIIPIATKLPQLNFSGIYSHFPLAYQAEDPSNQQQINAFLTIIQQLKAQDITFTQIHIANSDAVNNLPQTIISPFNMIRTGINLYGIFDKTGQRTVDLESVIKLKTSLAAVRKLPAGSYIGYGRTCCLEHDTLVGTIAAGYADGLPLALSNCGEVIIRNRRCRVIGRVSMDYTTVSLENIPDAVCGDEVICLGSSPGHQITIDDWATMKAVNSYEILCSFGPRVQRNYG